jgi:hypothetical protein
MPRDRDRRQHEQNRHRARSARPTPQGDAGHCQRDEQGAGPDQLKRPDDPAVGEALEHPRARVLFCGGQSVDLVGEHPHADTDQGLPGGVEHDEGRERDPAEGSPGDSGAPTASATSTPAVRASRAPDANTFRPCACWSRRQGDLPAVPGRPRHRVGALRSGRARSATASSAPSCREGRPGAIKALRSSVAPVADLVDGIQGQIDARLEELRPYAEEARDLQRALDAMNERPSPGRDAPTQRRGRGPRGRC